MFARLRTVLVTLFCATALLLCGCGGGGGTSSGTDPTVYFINSSADAGGLDFLLNGIVRALNLDYKDSSTSFTTIPYIADEDGAYDMVTRENATGDDLDAENRVFNKNSHYVIVAMGLKDFDPSETLKRIRSVGIPVDRTPPNGNKARLYIVHAFVRELGQATPAIIFQNAGDNPQFFTGAINFGAFTSLTVDSGTMDWWAKREDASGDVVYASATVNLDPGSVYMVLVTGIENDIDPDKQPSLEFIKIPTT